jgi:alkylation response protein AidB-like acyl-CoA dehydrogenase
MNFDPDPRSEVGLRGAESVQNDVLPRLPKEADAFFRDAHRELQTRGLFVGDSIEVAARVALQLATASGSLAVAFASGFAFGRASTLEGTITAAGNSGTRGPVLGVLDLGASLIATTSGQARKVVGESPFVIGGPVAARAVVLATTNDEQVLLNIDLSTAGVSRVPVSGALGFDSVPACALRFHEVTSDPPISGSSVASIQFLRNVRRVLDGAIAVGIGRHSFRLAVEYLRSLGKRPSQSTEFSLSDAATELDAAELSVLRSAWEIDRGSTRALGSASARMLATRAASRAAHTALVLSGTSGYTSDLRQCYLEACALELQSETSAEVATIASEMLEES